MLRTFDEFRNLKMTSMHEAYLCGSANSLSKILELNGYKMPQSGNKLINLTQPNTYHQNQVTI